MRHVPMQNDMKTQGEHHLQEISKMTSKPPEVWGRHGKDDSSQVSEGTNPATILILDFSPLELWKNTFLWLMPPSVWYFVMAALAN